ncbi:hypothetical protein V6N13_049647 [Hibiscus sabdariffa]|uniref:Rab-GAP TBC domain-containing protein n=1 Tax=Hibiscus sabdariffa TaxID=183260 RepID=A0ABR2QWJ4_9ROSI
MRGAHSELAESYYQVKPEPNDVPVTRFKIKPGKTLSARKWLAAFSPDGQLDIGKTLDRIHRGGVHPSIRGEVWEFLLGCYDPMSTFDERKQIRQQRRAQYVKWKKECSRMFPVIGSGNYITEPVTTKDDTIAKGTEMVIGNDPLDMKVTQWMLTLPQIGLDVKRTDRNLVFYEKQENLSKLWDILSVYAWIDIDVGYCQGMSDLCSPMIILLEDEADAFWCFERLMRRLMMWALEYDPDLFFQYEELELNMEKSEGSEGSKGKPKSTRRCGRYERDNMKIKSSSEPLPISVFLVASVLKDNSSVLQHKAHGLDDVVQILNDMTGNLDAKKACLGAMKLHKKYLKKVLLFSLQQLDDSFVALHFISKVSSMKNSSTGNSLILKLSFHVVNAGQEDTVKEKPCGDFCLVKSLGDFSSLEGMT